jgi:putative membrane protein
MDPSMRVPTTVIAAFCLLGQSAQASNGWSDAQTIGYLVSSDDGQIEMSKIIQVRSQNAEVKEFATHMITVHIDRTAQLLAIAEELGIKATGSADSSKLEATLRDDVAALKAATVADIDKKFLGEEVDHHRSVIQQLTLVLQPSAESAELKSVLGDMRARVPKNLANAQQLLTKAE